MPMDENILPSILDRLIDNAPDLSQEPPQDRYLNIRQIKEQVVRDLENLLNTRRHIFDPPDGFKEVISSLFTYGVSDFTSQNPGNISVKKAIRQDMEKVIARFEPRLRNVSVVVEGDSRVNSLKFRINAMLVVEPESEPVSFDTFFDVNRGEYTVKAS
jgi:type VI secretion system protein ImpF